MIAARVDSMEIAGLLAQGKSIKLNIGVAQICILGDTIYIDGKLFTRKLDISKDTSVKIVSEELRQEIRNLNPDYLLILREPAIDFNYKDDKQVFSTVPEDAFISINEDTYTPKDYLHIPVSITETGLIRVLLIDKASSEILYMKYSSVFYKENVEYRGKAISGQDLQQELLRNNRVRHINSHKEGYEQLAANLSIFGEQGTDTHIADIETDSYGNLLSLEISNDTENEVFDFSEVNKIDLFEIKNFKGYTYKNISIFNINKLDNRSISGLLARFKKDFKAVTVASLLGYKKEIDSLTDTFFFIIGKKQLLNPPRNLAKSVVVYEVTLFVVDDQYVNNPLEILYLEDIIRIDAWSTYGRLDIEFSTTDYSCKNRRNIKEFRLEKSYEEIEEEIEYDELSLFRELNKLYKEYTGKEGVNGN